MRLLPPRRLRLLPFVWRPEREGQRRRRRRCGHRCARLDSLRGGQCSGVAFHRRQKTIRGQLQVALMALEHGREGLGIAAREDFPELAKSCRQRCSTGVDGRLLARRGRRCGGQRGDRRGRRGGERSRRVRRRGSVHTAQGGDTADRLDWPGRAEHRRANHRAAQQAPSAAASRIATTATAFPTVCLGCPPSSPTTTSHAAAAAPGDGCHRGGGYRPLAQRNLHRSLPLLI